jgi:regulating synaptic membrane exocytosis protein 2
MTKTGLTAADTAMLRQMQDMQVGGPQGLADQTQDKRPKLERAHSAAEKENLPLLQRSGNCPLRRQYSQQEQVTFLPPINPTYRMHSLLETRLLAMNQIHKHGRIAR